jgi:hypothetical protein
MRTATGTLLIDWVDYPVLPMEAESTPRETGLTHR